MDILEGAVEGPRIFDFYNVIVELRKERCFFQFSSTEHRKTYSVFLRQVKSFRCSVKLTFLNPVVYRNNLISFDPVVYLNY